MKRETPGEGGVDSVSSLKHDQHALPVLGEGKLPHPRRDGGSIEDLWQQSPLKTGGVAAVMSPACNTLAYNVNSICRTAATLPTPSCQVSSVMMPSCEATNATDCR